MLAVGMGHALMEEIRRQARRQIAGWATHDTVNAVLLASWAAGALTATVLAAAPDEHAGIASGVNNALARAGSLLAVAALPVAVGLGGEDYNQPAVFDDGYRMAMIACAVMLTLGGIVSWLTIRKHVLEEPTSA